MNAENDRLPYEKPTLLCLIFNLGIIKGDSLNGEEVNGGSVEQPTSEPSENPDPMG